MRSKEDVKIVCNRILKKYNSVAQVYSDNLNGSVRVLIEKFEGEEDKKDMISHEIIKELGENTTVYL